MGLPNEVKENIDVTKGWSWGGSFGYIFMLVVAKKYWLLVGIIILMFIPLVNILTMLIVFIYGGINGKRMIYESKRFVSKEEGIGGIKAMEGIGKFLSFYIVIIVMAIFGTIAFISLQGYSDDLKNAKMKADIESIMNSNLSPDAKQIQIDNVKKEIDNLKH